MKTKMILTVMLFFVAQSFASSQTLNSGDTKRFKVGCVNFDMVYVEGGNFKMIGVAPGQSANQTVGNFYIGKYEVTQELWEEVMKSSPSSSKGNLQPVEMVSWDDIRKKNGFCDKLSKLVAPEGYKFALPTSAEWEYAARGGSGNIGEYGTCPDCMFAGSEDVEEVAWHKDNSGGKPHIVGKKKPNSLGLYDMSGNIYEWCEDLINELLHTCRGGAWKFESGDCRVFKCTVGVETQTNSAIGFRLVLVPIK